MTTVASTSDQVKEVSSWIHDEGKCVSIGAVSTGLQLSRGQAQALLQQIADNPSDQRSYQVTKCFVSEGKERQAEEAIACTGKRSSLWCCGYRCCCLSGSLVSTHITTSAHFNQFLSLLCNRTRRANSSQKVILATCMLSAAAMVNRCQRHMSAIWRVSEICNLTTTHLMPLFLKVPT